MENVFIFLIAIVLVCFLLLISCEIEQILMYFDKQRQNKRIRNKIRNNFKKQMKDIKNNDVYYEEYER